MWLCGACFTSSRETAKPLVLGSYAEHPVCIHGQNNQNSECWDERKFLCSVCAHMYFVVLGSQQVQAATRIIFVHITDATSLIVYSCLV